jgi:UDP-N-acetylmuramyl pentapeptide phosphotransferase/UDP-N-acetylglucosamine-1-phosphate transferase
MTLILMIVIGAGSYAGFVWWNQRPLVLELLGVFRSRFAGQSQA